MTIITDYLIWNEYSTGSYCQPYRMTTIQLSECTLEHHQMCMLALVYPPSMVMTVSTL